MAEVRRKFVGIAAGDMFSCYRDLHERIDKVQRASGVPIKIRDCVTLKGATKRTPGVARKARSQLMYYSLRYICALGRTDAQRDARYVKQGVSKDCICKHGTRCPAEIKIGLSEDFQFLVVRRIVEVHNHKISSKLFKLATANKTSVNQRYHGDDADYSPRSSRKHQSQRSQHLTKSPRNQREDDGEDNIFDKYTKHLKRKYEDDDLVFDKNIRVDDEQLSQDLDLFFPEIKTEVLEDYPEVYEPPKKISKRLGFKQLVEKMYCVEGSIVEVYQEGLSPQALYFQTKEMRSNFALFPEVLVIDSNYDVPQLGMKLYVVTNGDGNGECSIVSFWFLCRENAKNVCFLVDTFMDNNPEWFNAKVVMLNSEFSQRKAVLSRFSDSVTFTCYHHAVRSFQSEVYADRDIGFENEEERDTCMKLFKKMAAAKDLNTFLHHFERFRLYAPASLYTYFLENWHNMKDQWVDGLKDPNAYFLHQRHCRIDAINQVIESICINFVEVTKFFQDLMKSVSAMQLERKERSLNVPIKGPLITTDFHIAEMRYRNFLTAYAFTFVRKQMYSADNVKITDTVNEETCLIESVKYGKLETNASFCPCVFFSVIGLPCAHIFAVRQDIGLPTYEPKLCSKRWTTNYLRKSNDILERDTDLIPEGVVSEPEEQSDSDVDAAFGPDDEEVESNNQGEGPFIPSLSSGLEDTSDNKNLEEELIFDEVDPDGDLSLEFDDADGENDKEDEVVNMDLDSLLSKL